MLLRELLTTQTCPSPISKMPNPKSKLSKFEFRLVPIRNRACSNLKSDLSQYQTRPVPIQNKTCPDSKPKKNISFAEYINNGFYRSILSRSFCFNSIFLIFGFGSSFWMVLIRSSTVDTINSFASTLIGRRKSVTCCTIRKSI